MTDSNPRVIPKELQEQPITKDGLPWQAFAVVRDIHNPDIWFIPHHTTEVARAVKGKVGTERTVDWTLMSKAVDDIFWRNTEGERGHLSANEILTAAAHLANHYQKAGMPLPDHLAVLV